MSGDSLPLPLPLSGFATDSCEATTLYRELRKPLLRYLVRLGLSADEAQDMVQDAFLSLHRHLASGGSQDNIRSWLFRIAHNGARNRQHGYDRRVIRGALRFQNCRWRPKNRNLSEEPIEQPCFLKFGGAQPRHHTGRSPRVSANVQLCAFGRVFRGDAFPCCV